VSSKFPSDANIMKAMFTGQIDFMVEQVARDTSNDFQTRQQAANSIISLRGHVVHRDNVRAVERGIFGKCDKCGFKIFVPYIPEGEEWGIYGQLVELNCGSAAKGAPVKHSDMGPDLWKMFKSYIGAADLDVLIKEKNPDIEE